jgi:hypothetical protein
MAGCSALFAEYIACSTEVEHLETYRLKPITTKIFILAHPT